jgi:N-acetylglutamate synthase-like GNAT family acetyltransferase
VSAAVHRATIYRPTFGAAKVRPVPATRSTVIRSAVAADATGIHDLITRHAAEGRLLSRSLDEIASNIDRFLVATQHNDVVGCVDLAPLSASVVEVRSLVVAPGARAVGVGRRLLRELLTRAAAAGYTTLCAFTHWPSYFVRAGFSVVPHAWLPEKIERDCRGCSLFRHCGQYAVTFPLDALAVRLRAGAVNG